MEGCSDAAVPGTAFEGLQTLQNLEVNQKAWFWMTPQNRLGGPDMCVSPTVDDSAGNTFRREVVNRRGHIVPSEHELQGFVQALRNNQYLFSTRQSIDHSDSLLNALIRSDARFDVPAMLFHFAQAENGRIKRFKMARGLSSQSSDGLRHQVNLHRCSMELPHITFGLAKTATA